MTNTYAEDEFTEKLSQFRKFVRAQLDLKAVPLIDEIEAARELLKQNREIVLNLNLEEILRSIAQEMAIQSRPLLLGTSKNDETLVDLRYIDGRNVDTPDKHITLHSFDFRGESFLIKLVSARKLGTLSIDQMVGGERILQFRADIRHVSRHFPYFSLGDIAVIELSEWIPLFALLHEMLSARQRHCELEQEAQRLRLKLDRT